MLPLTSNFSIAPVLIKKNSPPGNCPNLLMTAGEVEIDLYFLSWKPHGDAFLFWKKDEGKKSGVFRVSKVCIN